MYTYSVFAARTELGDFVEYDLDNEDEDWLQDLNRERKILTPERQIFNSPPPPPPKYVA